MNFHNLGKKGEIVAANYLVAQGYKIIQTNYFNPKGYRIGEVDIVSKDPDGVLVFVEVKCRAGKKGWTVPEENITNSKIRKIWKAANHYLNQSGLRGESWRVDSVSIVFDFYRRKMDIKHIKSIRI